MKAISNQNNWQPSWLPKVFFIISGTTLTALSALTAYISVDSIFTFVLLGIICSFLILCFFTFKLKFLEKIFFNLNKAQLFISALLSLTAVYNNAIYFYKKSYKLIEKLPNFPSQSVGIFITVLGIFSIFAAFVYFYAFVSRFYYIYKDWISKTDKCEKYYFIISGIIFVVAIIVIYNSTTAFYSPEINGEVANNVISSADSASLSEQNAFINIGVYSNDIRQPLFGVFAAPFAALAYLLSLMLFFIPNAYPVMLAIVQIVLLLSCFITVSRMLNLASYIKMIFLIICAVTFPTLLFSVVLEQYIFALFWLTLFIYSYISEKEKRNYFFIAATGSLMTSGIMFPLIFDGKNFKECLRRIIRTIWEFLALLTIFGHFSTVLFAFQTIKSQLSLYSGVELSFYNKLLQFLNFTALCFIKPNFMIEPLGENFSYQLAYGGNLYYLAGIVFLILSILGFILNRKNNFAKICMVWVVISFLLLCVIGWGTKENGLVLYSLYFSWAYIALVFMLIEKLFTKWKTARYVIYSSAIIALVIVNFTGMYEIINFGIQHYPSR